MREVRIRCYCDTCNKLVLEKVNNEIAKKEDYLVFRAKPKGKDNFNKEESIYECKQCFEKRTGRTYPSEDSEASSKENN